MTMHNIVGALLCFLLLIPNVVMAEDYSGKKILWIDSYHEAYEWGSGEGEGIQDIIGKTKATFKIHRMDTKRNTSDEFKIAAGIKAKAVIEAFKPDIVIATDDNAQKYVVAKFYKDSDLPFVFAGVNWSADEYGYPYKNVTGMIEVNAAEELVELLSGMAKGNKIGLLTSDVITEHKDVEFTQKLFDFEFETRYVGTFEEWKLAFKDMQGQYDMLILQNNSGIEGWDKEEAKNFAVEYTKIPTGSYYDFMIPYVIVSYSKVAQEQGKYAAEVALRILDGEKISDIPIVKNQQGWVMVNARISITSGIDVPADILDVAEIVE